MSREDHGFKISEKRMVRKILGPKVEATGDRRKPNNEKLQNL